jgi:hypothetical protein
MFMFYYIHKMRELQSMSCVELYKCNKLFLINIIMTSHFSHTALPHTAITFPIHCYYISITSSYLLRNCSNDS